MLRVPSLAAPSNPVALMGCNQPDRGTPQCAGVCSPHRSELRGSAFAAPCREQQPDVWLDSLPSVGFCADLKVQIGRSQLSYVTGDKFQYATLTTDVESSSSLDAYPFDTYTFKGAAQVMGQHSHGCRQRERMHA